MNTLLAPEEPGPYQLINAEGSSELVLVCDHASNRIPAQLGDLGLNVEQLASHVAWDPGTALLARALSSQIDAPLVLSNYSRLVIDCNRHPASVDSIPVSSHGLAIPGNAGLSTEDKELRHESLFKPYHEAIHRLLDSRSSEPIRVLSIHSFSPSLAGVERPWSIGVCYRLYASWAREWLAALRSSSCESVGDNQPYKIDLGIDYTLPEHCEARQIPCIMLEIRQDRLQDQEAVLRWSELISQSWLDMT